MYRCPVCGYPSLDINPKTDLRELLGSYDICCCCGTEFGNDVDGFNCEEVKMSIELRRSEWLAAGHYWFSEYTKQPPDWDWRKNLKAIGVNVDDIE